jgi:hypothetical protein
VNVKPGDLARIVGHPDNSGRICKVLRPSHYLGAWVCEAFQTIETTCSIFIFEWSTKARPGDQFHAPDTFLRPLYDGDKEDEVLRIAGKPQETVRDVIADVSHPRRQVEHTR